ncbi:hypothetical protein [Lentzea sp. NPDC004782]|uniref:hypothetical protein n=1 Tax=Lentzea sp. NPDC004782 TaxID=3154458 RepID=UPI0033BA84A9
MRAKMILIDSHLWRWGVTSPPTLLATLRTFVFGPARIACPLLLLIGQAEYDRAPVHHVFDWLDEVFAPAAADHRATTRNTG